MSALATPVLYAVDLTGCEVLTALPPEGVAGAFGMAISGAGATIVEAVTHRFPGAGLTTVLILSESHAALHTWPEAGIVHIDIFSCSARFNCLEAIDALSRAFGARRVSVQEVRRVDGHSPQPAPRS